MKKNEIIELTITDIGVGGEGIGRFEGCTFFVKDAVFGDKVKAVITLMKKGYGYAKMQKILEPSACRIEAPCPHARRCGGCQIMEMDYKEQLLFKERKVRTNLERIGGLKNIEVLPVIGMDTAGMSVPLHYRNKLQFPFGRDKDGKIAAGFYAGRTHYIIDTEDCPEAPKEAGQIFRFVKSFLKEHGISVYNEMTGQGLVRHLVLRVGFRTGEIMVCLVLNGSSLNENNYRQNVDYDLLFVDNLLKQNRKLNICSVCINENRENTNVILGSEIRLLYGRDYIYDEIQIGESGERLKFKISPLSFYQVNPVQMEKLYTKALEFADLSGNETVWDLYCGIGTMSLFFAKKAKLVRGVEIVPAAIRDAQENAALNGISNAEFYCGKSEEIFPEDREKVLSSSVVVLDPPRKGCDRALLDAILSAGPERIVYVSCDSATLARDLKILTEGSSKTGSLQDPKGFRYQIEKVQPVDMFPNSVHVETCVLLIKEYADDDIILSKG